jgi:hypothetical protein
MKFRATLDKAESPISSAEIHFVQTCCQILKIVTITTTKVNEGKRDPTLTIMKIRKLLEALRAKAEAFRRMSPASYQTTCNSENHLRSFFKFSL